MKYLACVCKILDLAYTIYGTLFPAPRERMIVVTEHTLGDYSHTTVPVYRGKEAANFNKSIVDEGCFVLILVIKGHFDCLRIFLDVPDPLHHFFDGTDNQTICVPLKASEYEQNHCDHIENLPNGEILIIRKCT